MCLSSSSPAPSRTSVRARAPAARPCCLSRRRAPCAVLEWLLALRPPCATRSTGAPLTAPSLGDQHRVFCAGLLPVSHVSAPPRARVTGWTHTRAGVWRACLALCVAARRLRKGSRCACMTRSARARSGHEDPLQQPDQGPARGGRRCDRRHALHQPAAHVPWRQGARAQSVTSRPAAPRGCAGPAVRLRGACTVRAGAASTAAAAGPAT